MCINCIGLVPKTPYGTGCGRMELTSSSPNLIVSPIGNCAYNFTLVEGSFLTNVFTQNTQSIALAGNGEFANPIFANVIISPQPGNNLTILPDGLYSTGSGGGGSVIEPATQIVYGTGLGVDSSADLIWNGTTLIANGEINASSISGTGNRVLYANSAGTINDLPNTVDGYILTLSGGSPTWQPSPSVTVAEPNEQVVYGTGPGIDSNPLFLYRVGLQRLQITTTNGDVGLFISSTLPGSTSWAAAVLEAGADILYLNCNAATGGNTDIIHQVNGVYKGSVGFDVNRNSMRLRADGTASIDFESNSGVPKMRMFQNGHFVIGNTLVDDTINRLQVKGSIQSDYLIGVGSRVTLSENTGRIAALANGTEGHVLTIVSGTPAWAAPTGGGGGGSITLAPIGATPNANAATLTGSTLNLEPASASFGGVVTTGAQTFEGLKTFLQDVTAPGFYQSSSRELKSDISDFSHDGLNIVESSRIRNFVYKNDINQVKHIGFIIEEAPEEIVVGKTISHTNALAVAYKAIQELSLKIKVLEHEIKALSNNRTRI